MPKYKEWKRITFYLTPEEHTRLRLYCFNENISYSEFVRKLLLDALGIPYTVEGADKEA